MIYQNILETIGNTPVVRIRRLAPKGIEMYVKVEAFNPLGSVKDRLALGVILDAENRGLLKPGQTVVEATSGNTGIALAMVCAVRGYPFVSVMAESFSVERRRLMRFMGATVVLTPAALRATGMVKATEALAAKHGWFMTQQFENQANPAFHRNTTGPEVLSDFADRRLDYFVSGYGTGGTLSGVGQMIRAARPDVKIVSTEPAGARMLDGKEWQPHKIQGWTPDFLPDTLDREVAHENVPVTDEESITASQSLARSEGIFCGISSGGTFAAALKVAEKAEPGAVILAMLPDTGERYLSTPLFEDIPEGPDEGQDLLEDLEY
ncbi:MAG: cysteine synthase A [Xanthomonadales bacterium]|nr:cysteine synthase A [Gammaproteobacteria bacterium]MBT8050402.1 cysteine synthase A [Gammaproteobacteria bacterium]MBT8055926.1 cysteine synthase A [Gammaproteobacteria bacterium]NNJ80269.1 cysteine synthase A [Xanthomonadales bacterium]NNL05824.1 cysteine synthase A [Xanthomonadales bacterium]